MFSDRYYSITDNFDRPQLEHLFNKIDKYSDPTQLAKKLEKDPEGIRIKVGYLLDAIGTRKHITYSFEHQITEAKIIQLFQSIKENNIFFLCRQVDSTPPGGVYLKAAFFSTLNSGNQRIINLFLEARYPNEGKRYSKEDNCGLDPQIEQALDKILYFNKNVINSVFRKEIFQIYLNTGKVKGDSEFYKFALKIAILNNWGDIIRIIIAQHPSIKDEYGKIEDLKFSNKKVIDTIKLLLKFSFLIKVSDESIESLILNCGNDYKLNVIELILNNLEGEEKKSIIESDRLIKDTIKSKNNELFNLLLTHGMLISKFTWETLITDGTEEMVELAFLSIPEKERQSFLNPQSDEVHPIITASRDTGNYKTVGKLIELGANIPDDFKSLYCSYNYFVEKKENQKAKEVLNIIINLKDIGYRISPSLTTRAALNRIKDTGYRISPPFSTSEDEKFESVDQNKLDCYLDIARDKEIKILTKEIFNKINDVTIVYAVLLIAVNASDVNFVKGALKRKIELSKGVVSFQDYDLAKRFNFKKIEQNFISQELERFNDDPLSIWFPELFFNLQILNGVEVYNKIIISSDNKKFYVHSRFLENKSEFFKSMFNGEFQEGLNKECTYGCDSETLEDILKYIYTGTIEITHRNFKKLARESNVLILTCLQEKMALWVAEHNECSNWMKHLQHVS